MQMSKTTSKVIMWSKLLLTPIVIISFINPADGLWNAVYDLFLNPEVAFSTKLLTGVAYLIMFGILFLAAYKTIGRIGLAALLVVAGALMYFLWDHGYVAFDTADSFGWAGMGVAIAVAYVGLFGTTIYRFMTGRYSIDSHDPDTEPHSDHDGHHHHG